MNFLRVTIVLLLFTTPALSQDLGDLGGFLGSDAGSLLNIPAPRGDAPARGTPPPRGAGPRGAAAGAPVDRLASVRDLLARANTPLTPEQEVSLNAILDAELPTMRLALQARVRELQAAQRGATAPLSPDALMPDLNRQNDQLLAKLAAAPALTPDQQAGITKAMKDQILARGGFDALNLTMTAAGVPFNADQTSQIQALFVEQSQLRTQLTDPAQQTQLQRETLTKVLRLLTAEQRAALAGPR